MFQVQLLPSVVLPPTLFVFAAVRSGAFSVTVSVAALLLSSLSLMLLFGSTDALLAYVPTVVGVAVNCTSNAPGPARVTVPLAVQVRVFEAIAQLTVPARPTALAMARGP